MSSPAPSFFLAMTVAIGSAIKMGLDFAIEKALHARGYCHVAGVDEVGRGPLAGPVTAAAVILNPKDIPAAVNDSKKLSKKTREQVYEALLQTAKISVAHATVAEIDSLNILRASHLAMNRALDGLSTSADYALIDGNMLPRRLALPGAAFVKGDARVASIAAASIVAKVCRDRVMLSLAQQHPGYGWETNAGYGTPAHLCALRNLGITPHHRRSFKPVYNML